MNWNDNNKGPWGSGGGNNPWSGGPSNKDFENILHLILVPTDRVRANNHWG